MIILAIRTPVSPNRYLSPVLMVDFTQVNGHLFLVKKQVGIKLRLKGPLAAGTSQQTAAAGAPVSLALLALLFVIAMPPYFLQK